MDDRWTRTQFSGLTNDTSEGCPVSTSVGYLEKCWTR